MNSLSFSIALGILFLTRIIITCSSQIKIHFLPSNPESLQTHIKSWLRTGPQALQLAKWFGITCNINNQITSLKLSNINLKGTLSPNLGNLTYLTTLVLSSNNLTGTLPSQLSFLHRLETINLWI